MAGILDDPSNQGGIIQSTPAGIGYPGPIPPIRPPNPYGPPTLPMQGPIPPIRPPNPYGAPQFPSWRDTVSPNTNGGAGGGPTDLRPYSYPLGLEYFAQASNPNWQPTGTPSRNIEDRRSPTQKLGPYSRARIQHEDNRHSQAVTDYWARGGNTRSDELGAVVEQLSRAIDEHKKEAKK